MIEGIAVRAAEKYYDGRIDASTLAKGLAPYIEDAIKEAIPIHVRLALRVLLRHIEEPTAWQNCKSTAESWLDSLPHP